MNSKYYFYFYAAFFTFFSAPTYAEITFLGAQVYTEARNLPETKNNCYKLIEFTKKSLYWQDHDHKILNSLISGSTNFESIPDFKGTSFYEEYIKTSREPILWQHYYIKLESSTAAKSVVSGQSSLLINDGFVKWNLKPNWDLNDVELKCIDQCQFSVVELRVRKSLFEHCYAYETIQIGINHKNNETNTSDSVKEIIELQPAYTSYVRLNKGVRLRPFEEIQLFSNFKEYSEEQIRDYNLNEESSGYYNDHLFEDSSPIDRKSEDEKVFEPIKL